MDPGELALQRRYPDVELVARAQAAFVVVGRCLALRNLVGALAGHPIRSPYAAYRNPELADDGETFAAFVESVRAGAEPWLATASQVSAAELEAAEAVEVAV